jgi:NAD(P)-dependent dehydrogenase (short-subunit alcohol dehydrogenase family)
MTLQGKTAIVTGAARGIAARLTEAGCRVAAWDLDPSPLLTADDPEALSQK